MQHGSLRINVVMSVHHIAATRGHLDKVEVRDVPAWEKQFLTFMREQRASVRNTLVQQRSFQTHDRRLMVCNSGMRRTMASNSMIDASHPGPGGEVNVRTVYWDAFDWGGRPT